MRIETVLILISALACGTSSITYIKQRDNPSTKAMIYGLWHLGMLTISTSIITLIGYQIGHQFEFSYVYQHTSLDLPLIYRISALWAGQEGSFLVWAFILVIMGYRVLKMSYRSYTKAFPIYVGITVAVLLMSFITNPFKMLGNLPSDGMGLNSALQDPWMVVHPPLVFIGYTGMAIIFSLGIGGEEDDVIMKHWIRISLLFLGLGIMTGSVWAYRALGWGGYWSWDPIENIALVPWLLLCADAHGKIKMTKIKCILPFSIAAFGTFLARSGLLQGKSAHAYVGSGGSWTVIVLGLFIIGGIMLVGYGMIYKKQDRKNIMPTDMLTYFRVITYGYAFIILAATILPLFKNDEVPRTFYNYLTLGYIILNSLLMLVLEKDKIGKKGILSIMISAVLSMGIAKAFQYTEFRLVFVLWIILIALVGYLLIMLKRKNKYYYWTHLLLLLMFAGGITSAGMGGQYMETITQEEATTLMQEDKTMMINNLTFDQIVDEISYDNNHQKATMTYATKPLIILFWIGSFGILGMLGIKVTKEQYQDK